MTDDLRQRTYWEDERGLRAYSHPVVRLFAEQRLELLARMLPLAEVRSALDVGCGDGASTYYAARHLARVCGTDRSFRMLRRHPLRQRVTSADVRALPYADGAFDLVYAWEVLHHVSEPTAVVAEMARVSRRFVVVLEPNRNNPAQAAFALWDPEHRWVLRYSRRYLAALCRNAGLHVLTSFTGGYIFPNRTPLLLAGLLRHLPYRSPIGITNWVVAEKP